MSQHEAKKPLSKEQRREVFRALVEAQGGSVVAYSCPDGPGSVFEFTLPVAPAE